jgi:hypothetical protein
MLGKKQYVCRYFAAPTTCSSRKNPDELQTGCWNMVMTSEQFEKMKHTLPASSAPAAVT